MNLRTLSLVLAGFSCLVELVILVYECHFIRNQSNNGIKYHDSVLAHFKTVVLNMLTTVVSFLFIVINLLYLKKLIIFSKGLQSICYFTLAPSPYHALCCRILFMISL